MQSPDPAELPVLELDLGWELPDFAAIGEYNTLYVHTYIMCNAHTHTVIVYVLLFLSLNPSRYILPSLPSLLSNSSSDSPHTPYGHKALNSALQHLHGFYRTSLVLWQCQDWQDWNGMTVIADIEGHWAEVRATGHWDGVRATGLR